MTYNATRIPDNIRNSVTQDGWEIRETKTVTSGGRTYLQLTLSKPEFCLTSAVKVLTYAASCLFVAPFVIFNTCIENESRGEFEFDCQCDCCDLNGYSRTMCELPCEGRTEEVRTYDISGLPRAEETTALLQNDPDDDFNWLKN